MRFFILVCFFIIATICDAQIFVPGSYIDYNYRGRLNSISFDDSASNKKWSVSKYAGISTAFSFFKGGNATVVAAPLGLQLNRKLSNNLFAFAGVSVAPSYVNFNSMMNTNFSKMNATSSFRSGGMAVYSRAELGLQYVNDERTFSISGSIGIEGASYPMPLYLPGNSQINSSQSLRR